jgi:hypothetical protein
MSLRKIILSFILFWFTCFNLSGQNWQSLGNGTPHHIRNLYADTSSSLIYATITFIVNNPHRIYTYNGILWDSLPVIGNDAYSLSKFQNKIIVSSDSNTTYYFENGLWIPIFNQYIKLYNYKDSIAYLTGWFSSINGVNASKIAKWDGVNLSAIDTTVWYGGAISSAIVFNNELYVAGNMVNYNGSIDRIAKWNGVQWQSLGNGIIGGMGGVNCMVVYNNELYVGGMFNISNGNPGNAIAKWDGQQWHDVGGGMSSTNAQIYDMIVFEDELWVVGGFSIAGGQPIKGIAKWNGIDWCGLGFNPLNGGNQITNIEMLHNEIYIAGGFKEINGDTVNYIAKWNGGSFTDVCGNTTSIKNEFANQDIFTLFPNPATQSITIKTNIMQTTTLLIYNVMGKEVYRQQITAKETNVDVSALSNGLYFVRVNDEVRKFIKGE